MRPRRSRLPRRLASLLAPPAALVLLLAGPGQPSRALASPGAAQGAGEAASAPAGLTLSVGSRPGHPAELLLSSHLRGASHKRGGSVAFFVVSKEFKSPAEVPIGTAKMAANGAATLVYKPTWSGREEFLAKLAGPGAPAGPGAHVPAANASFDVTASSPGPLFATANQGKPLASVGIVFLRVIQSLVALIWLGLIVTLVMVRARMPRLARERTE